MASQNDHFAAKSSLYLTRTTIYKNPILVYKSGAMRFEYQTKAYRLLIMSFPWAEMKQKDPFSGLTLKQTYINHPITTIAIK